MNSAASSAGGSAHSGEEPYDREAEQAVLGALLLVPRAVDTVVSVLRSGADFYEAAHEEVYRAVLAVHDRPGVRADPITVAAELGRRGSLVRVGGASYLHTLVQAVPTAANAEHYAEKVAEAARRRDLIRALTAGLQRARLLDNSPEEAAEATLAELRRLAGNGGEQRGLWLGDLVPQFVDELEAGSDPDALDTPWPDLNAVVELKPGQLITVGAATGGGKSLFAMNLVAHVGLRRARPVLMASLEMGSKELVARLFASEATVPLDRLVRRRVEDRDWERMAAVAGMLQQAPVVLDDSPSLTVGTLRSRIRWMAAQGRPPALVVVDYLQLLTPERSGRATTRAQEVGDISRGLKLLAGEFGVPVVALAQFNRGSVGRRPLVSDFKESSAIEQDSNVIVLLHRELDGDGGDTGPKAGTVEAIVAKNRNGAAGRVVDLAFQGHYGRLTSLHGSRDAFA
ncbi:replicative DNA helicase [Streptomyces sp. NPDC058301]|uniref:replicative DNA helicase n=1 Tax=Streptomyces sp. NPDC058301 TaxID=3346436 RepID=UPI0036E5F8F6